MFIYFRRITRKISKLAGDVSKIGAGELEVLTPPKGKDEITSLADDVNRMCISIRENAVKEREAWEANAGLITAMSHDLRTPLTVLMGYLDIIAMQEELSQDTKNYLQTCIYANIFAGSSTLLLSIRSSSSLLFFFSS